MWETRTSLCMQHLEDTYSTSVRPCLQQGTTVQTYVRLRRLTAPPLLPVPVHLPVPVLYRYVVQVPMCGRITTRYLRELQKASIRSRHMVSLQVNPNGL